jgi:hypothetical protein
MKIGERFIEGQIKERGQARQIYEAARAEGARRVSLSRNGPTSSPTMSPISVRMKVLRCRSNIRNRCASIRAATNCGCRWW